MLLMCIRIDIKSMEMSRTHGVATTFSDLNIMSICGAFWIDKLETVTLRRRV